jgi:hypothetical protein
VGSDLKVHKNANLFGSDFEFCTISLFSYIISSLWICTGVYEVTISGECSSTEGKGCNVDLYMQNEVRTS